MPHTYCWSQEEQLLATSLRLYQAWLTKNHSDCGSTKLPRCLRGTEPVSLRPMKQLGSLSLIYPRQCFELCRTLASGPLMELQQDCGCSFGPDPIKDKRSLEYCVVGLVPHAHCVPSLYPEKADQNQSAYTEGSAAACAAFLPATSIPLGMSLGSRGGTDQL